jgi:membrane-associated protein
MNIDTDLEALIGEERVWISLVLSLVILLVTGLVVTPFLPGDSLLFISGALAARRYISVAVLCMLLAFAAITGDSLDDWIGKSHGMNLLHEKYPTHFRERNGYG